jgi:hypothetical protein
VNRRDFAAVALAAAALFHLRCTSPQPPLVVAVQPAEAVSIGRTRNITFSSGCTSAGLERCFNAIDDDCNGQFDEGCGTPDGLVQLIVAWEAVTVDVDLEVVDANGNLAKPDTVTQLGYVKDRDCPMNATCADQNTETVSTLGISTFQGPIRVALRVKNHPFYPPRVRVQWGGHIGRLSISAQTTLVDSDDGAAFEVTQ